MKYLLKSVLLLLSISSLAQQAELNAIVADIKSNLVEVQTGDETYTHELELLEYSILKYTLAEVDEKGNKKEYSYEFNIADLDPYVVREETKKDIIYLSLTIDNRQKFIKKYENGEVKGYVESMLIVTESIDNARALKTLVKEAIPMAKEVMSKKLSVKTYPEMENWLEEHIVNAEGGSKTYNQTLVGLDDFPGHFRFIQTEITSKTSKERQYNFNISDINPNSLKFIISGSSLSLSFETKRKQKVIDVLEGEASKGFDNSIKIYTNNVEEARDIRNILIDAVPLAEKRVEGSIQKFDQFQSALTYLEKFIVNVDYGDEVMEQSISGDCILTFNQLDSDTKKTLKTTSEVNLIDINVNLIDVDVASGKMFVEFTTNESLDLIKSFENDEFNGYEDNLRIYAENIEIARRIQAALENIIRICERDYVDPFASMSVNQKINWLIANTVEQKNGTETITQTFEQINSDPEKIKLTKLNVDAKGSQEEIFEFNFTDINPASIKYKIGSKTLAVSFETKFKEDIIKYYKDGEIENYQDGFELNLTDIESARNVILAFNQIIAELNE